MKPIQPDELSAYLDGELDMDRAAEVATALRSNPALRADYDALANADGDWKSAAYTAQFESKIAMTGGKTATTSPLAVVGCVALLIALRSTLDLRDIVVWGVVLHSVALAIALPWIVRMARESQNQL